MLKVDGRQARVKRCLGHVPISSYEIAKRLVKKALKDAEEMIDGIGVGNQINVKSAGGESVKIKRKRPRNEDINLTRRPAAKLKN